MRKPFLAMSAALLMLPVFLYTLPLFAEGEEEAVAEEQAPAEEAVAEESAPPPVAPSKAPKVEAGRVSAFGKPDFLADGSRIVVREGDFSIKPPQGWEVFSKRDNLTLLMQVPHQPGMRYQRTIQVASFSEPRFIDEMTAKEYENVIVQKFSAVSSAIEDYHVRNHMTVDLTDGRSGLLFYTEFKLEGVPLMQAHILVSSADRHYLMTFTDVAEHFESDEASQFLTEAWDSLTSVELSTRSPQRFETFAAVGVGVVALTVIIFGLIAFRTWRSGRKYHMYADGRGLDSELTDDDMPISAHSGVSQLEPRRKQKQKQKEKEQESSITDPQSLASSDHPETQGSDVEDAFTIDDIAI